MIITERKARENGREYALRVIRENIISMELKPGTMVSANELAPEIGVSRGPVREALTELSKTGIVEVYPQSGCRISLIDEEMIAEARFMRNALECSVINDVCEHITIEDKKVVRENLAYQEFLLQNNMAAKLLEADNEFHKKLFEIANRSNVYDLMKEFVVHLDRLRSLSVFTLKNLKIVDDHKSIFDAIDRGDVREAKQFMEKHLNRDKFDMKDLRIAHPDFFSVK